MLEEVKEDEGEVSLQLDKEEEIEEDLNEKYALMKKNLESALGIDQGFNEDAMKYDILVEQISKHIEENTDEVSHLLQLLVDEESSYANRFNQPQR
jgi:flagellar M-ring protein FliF